jgi:ubiquinone/menaquinone biosynthesis C-methylase UbiE
MDRSKDRSRQAPDRLMPSRTDPLKPNRDRRRMTTSELSRVPEEEMMDTPEEAHGYDAMDHTVVNARFVADFLAEHGAGRGGSILDVGTGTALIPIALAAADRRAKIVAVDGAAQMLELARRNVDALNLADRIELRQCDAKAMPFKDGVFEAVVSNSIVHHIPDPAIVLKEMVRLVAPGGTLFVRDLSRPASRDRLKAIVQRYTDGESDIARSLFEESLHAALTPAEAAAILTPLGLPASCVGMTSDRHWTIVWKRSA